MYICTHMPITPTEMVALGGFPIHRQVSSACNAVHAVHHSPIPRWSYGQQLINTHPKQKAIRASWGCKRSDLPKFRWDVRLLSNACPCMRSNANMNMWCATASKCNAPHTGTTKGMSIDTHPLQPAFTSRASHEAWLRHQGRLGASTSFGLRSATHCPRHLP